MKTQATLTSSRWSPAEPVRASAGAQPQVSIVVPVYDEARGLRKNLERLGQACSQLAATCELIFVDDGSNDESYALLLAYAKRDTRVRVLALDAHRGKGAAVRMGMLAARGAAIVCMDADLSTDLAALPEFIAELRAGWDVVFGNRRLADAQITQRQPRLREWLGRGFTFLTRRALGSPISDFTCGFKAFRHAAAQHVFAESRIDGWAYDAEIAALIQQRGLRLREVPVRWAHCDIAGPAMRADGWRYFAK